MLLLKNKTAHREFEIQQTYTAGVVLTGPEVKSLRLKHGSFAGSFVKIVNGEAWLLNAQINPYSFADNRNYDPKRSRKLLLSKKEIDHLTQADQQKRISIIPLSFESIGKKIKLIIGIGRGKKEFEKRADLKARAIQRDVERELKSRKIHY